MVARSSARWLFCVCAILLIAPVVAAQEAPAPAKIPDKSSDPKGYALGRVRALADRITELHDTSSKVRALISLGNGACKYDKSLAETAFTKANDSLAVVAREEEEEKEKNKGAGVRFSFSMANSLRSQLVASAGKCDATFAARVRVPEGTKTATSINDSSPYISAALQTLRDAEKPDEAIKLAEQSLEGQPPDRTYVDFSTFLLQLRRKDEAAAHRLFLDAVAKLRAQPKPNSYHLMGLGNFLFGFMDESKNPQFVGGVGFTSVGGVSVISLLYPRLGISPQVTRSFLEASLDMLSRPTTDGMLQKLDYAAAFQLLPHARTFAPDLAPSFDLVLKRLDASVPERMRQGAPNTELSRLTSSFGKSEEEYEAELEKTTEPQQRQFLIYQIAYSALQKRNFSKARKFAADLENKDFRAKFLGLIEFEETSKFTDDGRLDEALAKTKLLPAGVERGLMLANIAAAQVKKGETRAALSLLDAAQRETENVPADMLPAYLVGLTSVLAGVDRDAAVTLLAQAVTAMNERDRVEKPTDAPFVVGGGSSPTSAEISLRAAAGGFMLAIRYARGATSRPLNVKGIDAFEMNATLLRRFSAEAERVESILIQLQEEIRLGPALAALAAAYLEGIPQEQKADVRN
jgi:hypothetical protein